VRIREITMQTATPFIWYRSDLGGALARYTAVIPGFRVLELNPIGPDGSAGSMARFAILDREFLALQSPADFALNESFSIMLLCEDQAEVDRCWDGLTADGGEPGRCGWLKDAWGLSWQVVPTRLQALLSDPDPAAAGRAHAAMMGMSKIVVAELEAARAGG
jgi:predicted 3-demethylubiquinone-9 3-methyltransferase (glyoxalase superfamily)